MEKLITPVDVMQRYGCSRQTARKYIRQCNPHMEKPLAVPEWAFNEWEIGRTVYKAKKMSKAEYEQLVKRFEAGRVIVPRRR